MICEVCGEDMIYIDTIGGYHEPPETWYRCSNCSTEYTKTPYGDYWDYKE